MPARKSRKSPDSRGGACSGTAISRALAIPEVLSSILVFADKITLGRCAVVSRSWSAHALDHLWRRLDSIAPLWQLASLPTTRSSHSYDRHWTLTRSVAYTDWDRFHAYAKRVRTLKLSDGNTAGPPGGAVDSASMYHVSYLHPFGGALVPNITSLEFRCSNAENLLILLPFLSAPLTHFYLFMGASPTTERMQTLFKCLVHRTPGLRKLEITLTRNPLSFTKQFAEWISTTPKLEEVTLPSFHHTESNIASLGQLPKLHSLKTEWLGYGDFQEEGVQFRFTKNTFTNLKQLEFDGLIQPTIDQLRLPSRFSQLTHITFACQREITLPLLQALFSSFAEACPAVKFLRFNLFAEEEAPPSQPFGFDYLRPLLSCSKLLCLEVRYDRPICLQEQDVYDMAEAWPDVQTLILAPDPDLTGDAAENGTRWDILRTFASELTSLETLGLYFDPALPTFDGDLNSGVENARLDELNVGTSAIPGGNPAGIGFFIASLFAESPAIDADVAIWSRQELPNDERRLEAWRQVGEVIRMAIISKNKFTTKLGDLQETIDELESMSEGDSS